jgi:phosphoenolpyruvate synthase/pyruvate phosphate dikinase
LMGGKSLNCWKLARHGFPIPTAFVIPTYVYSLHIDEADVASLINDVYTADLKDETAHGAAKAKLATIREKIMKTELNPEVVNNLKLFLESLVAGSFVAVRSSSSAEDLDSQSFAGQYDTCKFFSIKIHNIMFLCFSLSYSILNQSSPRLDVAHACIIYY